MKRYHQDQLPEDLLCRAARKTLQELFFDHRSVRTEEKERERKTREKAVIR